MLVTGEGFAAPQLGISKSVFSTFVDGKADIFINPVIFNVSEDVNYYRELCLSSGVMYADMARPEWIEMKWTDGENKQRSEKFSGFLARLYQHENDHLIGELNLYKCGPGHFGVCNFDPLKEVLRTTR